LYLYADAKGERLFGSWADGILVWDPATGKVVTTLKPTGGRRVGGFVPWGDTLAVALHEGGVAEQTEGGVSDDGKVTPTKVVRKGVPPKVETWLWHPDQPSPTKLLGKDFAPYAASADGKLRLQQR
jgi:hypothetical protein